MQNPIVAAILSASVDPLGVQGCDPKNMCMHIRAEKRGDRGRIFYLEFRAWESCTQLKLSSNHDILGTAHLGYDRDEGLYFVATGTNSEIPLPQSLSFLRRKIPTRNTEEESITTWVHKILEGFAALS